MCFFVLYFFPQDLAAVDHSKVYYQPFRKNFYVEVPELAKLTPEGKEPLFNRSKNEKRSLHSDR